MAARSPFLWPTVASAAGIVIFTIALPQEWKGWAPSVLRDPMFHFGLDLAGGTQLDFRISEAEIEKQLQNLDREIAETEQQGNVDQVALLRSEQRVVEEQRQNIVEAIRTVLERRINALGVSEATITPSYIGGEKHLLVECPGVIDVQECIETVGKTIQLEFKEEFTETTEEYAQSVRERTTAALSKVRSGQATLQVLGQDLGSQLGIGYSDSTTFFRDQLPRGLESTWGRSPRDGVLLKEGAILERAQGEDGKVQEESIPGIFLVEVITPRTMTGRTINDAPSAFATLERSEPNTTYALQSDVTVEELPQRMIAAIRSMRAGELRAIDMEDGSARILFLRLLTPGREEVAASHILVAYSGASGAGPAVTRTKEEAVRKVQELKQQLTAGARFEDLAQRQSDGESGKNGGSLGTFARGTLMPAFEEVAFSAPIGQISDSVETPFGFHLIRVDRAPRKTPDQATIDTLTVTGADAVARANTFLSRMQTGRLTRQEEHIRLRFLFFSLKPTGWQDTALDGKHFKTASVTTDPTLNLPVVQIVFDAEGGKIFQQLTKRNVGKRIAIFVGGELVSAPTVQQEISGGTAIITGSRTFEEARTLAQDLNTGAIPAPIYLSGQRTVEATLGAQAVQTSVKAGLVGTIVLMIYLIFAYRFLGVIGNIALLIYGILFLAILKLPLFLFSNQYIVLTLAGAAGMILSIGLAVDTNVLVFERVKEELRKGKMLKTAFETGFTRAWPSIRDSNVATLITCALLFLIGTSIVRGFAVTLGMGVFISMFTGMVITRWICRRIAQIPAIAEKPWLFQPSQKVVGHSSPQESDG